jgi:hypothetical protein
MMARHASAADLAVILDPAVGKGELLSAAVERADALGVTETSPWGIDLDPEMACLARDRLDQASVVESDFLKFDLCKIDPTFIIANPPYGAGRELQFFVRCDAQARPGTLMVFLMPLSFLDRVRGPLVYPIDGRPLGVTTGHAIVVHRAGEPFEVLPVRGTAQDGSARSFEVLTGLKLYERGAGTPPQTEEMVRGRVYSSDVELPGWLPCLRTGDVQLTGVQPGRLWVRYGDHLASPKSLNRFTGPRLILRRMPIWSTRRLCAVYTDVTALCAGDLLIVKHPDDDRDALQELAEWLCGEECAELIHGHRPSVKLRDSYPKISAKDVHWLLNRRYNSKAGRT